MSRLAPLLRSRSSSAVAIPIDARKNVNGVRPTDCTICVAVVFSISSV